MVIHQTFTSDSLLAKIVGQGDAGSNSVSFNVGGGDYRGLIGPGGTPVVRIERIIDGGPSVSVEAILFGNRFFDANGRLERVDVTKIQWRLANTTEILSEVRYETPQSYFTREDLRLVNIISFVDLFAGTLTPIEVFDAAYTGSDQLIGGAGSDKFDGRAGDDRFLGAGGADLLIGGGGNDTFLYQIGDAVAGEEVFGGAGTDTLFTAMVAVSYDFSLLTLDSVEVLDMKSSTVTISATQLQSAGNPSGIASIIGGTGFESLTITNAGGVNFNLLNLVDFGPFDLLRYSGGTGADQITGTARSERFFGGSGADALTGNGGNDIFELFENDASPGETIAGGEGTDTISFFGSNSLFNVTVQSTERMVVNGGATISSVASSLLSPTAIREIVGGTAGNKQVIISVQTDFFNLGTVQLTNWNPSTDKFIIQAAFTDPFGNGAFVIGSSGNDDILGFGGHDTLSGGAGNDYISAGGGQNSLEGGPGGDQLIGGNLLDTASYAGATSAVQVYADELNRNQGDAQGDTYSSIEKIVGSDFNDIIYWKVAAGSEAFNGNLSVRGGNGDDVLRGAANGGTLVNGEAGNDLLFAIGLSDTLIGDTGIDTASFINFATPALVGLNLTMVNATATGGRQFANFFISNNLKGSVSNDVENIIGTVNNDTVNGNLAANTLYGNAGEDLLRGGGGDDTLVGGRGLDYLDGGTNTAIGDTANYSTSSTSVGVTVNLNIVTQTSGGDASGDRLVGIENLVGSNAGDVLTGNAGANILNGGLGNDTLAAGLGNDTFVFNTALSATLNRDIITDFNVAADTIRLENAVFNKLVGVGTLSLAQFHKGAGVTASHDLDDRIIYNTTTGALYYDADGNKAGGVAAVHFATLTGSPDTLTNADFFII